MRSTGSEPHWLRPRSVRPVKEETMHKIDNLDVPLAGKKVAILVADGFEQVEMTEPRNALEAAGADTSLVSPASGTVKGWEHTHWGNQFNVDIPLDEAHPEDFDALLLPGGVMNPDHLR